ENAYERAVKVVKTEVKIPSQTTKEMKAEMQKYIDQGKRKAKKRMRILKSYWAPYWFISVLCAACGGAAEEQQADEHVQALPPGEVAAVRTMVLQEQTFHHELISNGTV